MASNSERPGFRAVGRWAGTVAGAVAGRVSVEELESNRAVREIDRSAEHIHDDVHFERTDISIRAVFLTGVAVLVGTIISILLVHPYFALLARQHATSSPPPLPIEAHGNPLPPQPRLQASPPKDYQAYIARENWELTHYHWVNKAQGVVAIPIGEAMKLVAQRGIPPQKQPPNLQLSEPQAGTRETGFEGKVEPEPR